MILQHHQPRDENGGLEKGGQAQTDDLLAPAHESVQISSRDAEHVQAAHRDLDEQDAAALQVGEKHLDHGVTHHDEDKNQHDGIERASDPAEHSGVRRFFQRSRGGQLADDVSGHGVNPRSKPGDASREAALQGNRELIQLHRYRGEKSDREKALDVVERGILDASPAGLVLDAALKDRHHQTGPVERPPKVSEKQNDGFHPGHVEQVRAHVSHGCEKIAEEPDHLAVDPVQNLPQHGIGHEVPYEHGRSPPSKNIEPAFTGSNARTIAGA